MRIQQSFEFQQDIQGKKVHHPEGVQGPVQEEQGDGVIRSIPFSIIIYIIIYQISICLPRGHLLSLQGKMTLNYCYESFIEIEPCNDIVPMLRLLRKQGCR